MATSSAVLLTDEGKWRRAFTCTQSRASKEGSRTIKHTVVSILCFCVKDDDCGTLAESAAPPAAGRESVTSKQSNDLRGSRLGPVYNLDRRRAVAEKMQSSSAVIQTAIIMILPAGVHAFRKYLNFQYAVD